MKRILSFFAALLMTAVSASAQTIVKGDMNGDGLVNVADVTSVVNVAVGRAQMETLSLGGSPYQVDNSMVVGIWYAPDGTHFALNADGSTDYGTDFTYKFRPYQGTLTMFNSSGTPVKTFVLNEVEESYLLAVDYVTGTYTLYSNSDYRVSELTLSETNLTMILGTTEQLTVTVTPPNALNSNVTWTSSDDDVATVDANGLVTAVSIGICTITCTAKDGSGVVATCAVTVSDASDSHAYVDLGLPSGTLWATCNIGADSPEDYGDYFAWGETSGYNGGKTTFDWSTYKYCNGSSTSITKYCCNSSIYNGFTFTDTLTELEPEDDAATANWGSEWCIPTKEQFDELINSSYTTTMWTIQNEVSGRLITSKIPGYTENSIFLPAAGSRSNTSINYLGSSGFYWSRTLRTEFSFHAYILNFFDGRAEGGDHDLPYGISVRPVRSTDVSNVQLVTSLILSQDMLSLVPNEQKTLTATILPSNADNPNVLWTSSDDDVATVDANGLVTAVSIGICTIT